MNTKKVDEEKKQEKKLAVNEDEAPAATMPIAKRDLPDNEMKRSTWFDINEFTPAISFENTTISYVYRPKRPYRLFNQANSAMIVTFNVPPSVRSHTNGNMYVHLYCCRTTADGIIDMTINSNNFLKHYGDAPRDNFGIQTFTIPYNDLSLKNENIFKINLSSCSSGVFWLSDISFSFEDESKTNRKFGETYPAEINTTGAYYQNVEITDSYRKGNPYLIFKKPGISTYTIEFFTPDNFYDLKDVSVDLALNHCGTTLDACIDMKLNGSYISDYKDAPEDIFAIQHFELPSTSLKLDGQKNIFEIQLFNCEAFYSLSDARVTFEVKKPEVTKSTFESIVKNWILHQRKNIAELSVIPQNDYSEWKFIKNAPSWFYLPFLPASPSEIAVLIKSFPLQFYTVAKGMQIINQQARSFHKELLVSDLPKKNAYRHAYWMALTTREYGADFAVALGDAHEYVHVDLTIEGPYDHVTDKINNAVGVEMAHNDKSTDCEILVDKAWNNNQLAWAKDFRVENGKQTADIFWKEPLEKLASMYKVVPDFNSFEKATLKKHGVALPNDPPIHDEL